MREQILIGTLLGDAYIPRLKEYYTHGIAWEHSLKQEEYALWKAESSLDNYFVKRRDRTDSRTGNTYHSILCHSIKDNYIYYRKIFYLESKQVSQQILDMLEPLGIAVWFMDDGNMYYNGNNCHLTLSVNGFDDNSVNLIINYFYERYNIKFKKAGKAIRLTSVAQVKLFESFFQSFYHKSMLYKTLTFQKDKYNNEKTEPSILFG